MSRLTTTSRNERGEEQEKHATLSVAQAVSSSNRVGLIIMVIRMESNLRSTVYSLSLSLSPSIYFYFFSCSELGAFSLKSSCVRDQRSSSIYYREKNICFMHDDDGIINSPKRQHCWLIDHLCTTILLHHDNGQKKSIISCS